MTPLVDWVRTAKVRASTSTNPNGNPGGNLTNCGCARRVSQLRGITHECAAVPADYRVAWYFSFGLPELPQPGAAEISGKLVVLYKSEDEEEPCLWKERVTHELRCPDGVETGHFELVLIGQSLDGETLHPKALLRWVVDSYEGDGESCGYKAVAYCPLFDALGGGLFEWQPGNCLQVAGCFCVAPQKAKLPSIPPCGFVGTVPRNWTVSLAGFPTTAVFESPHPCAEEDNFGLGTGIAPVVDINGEWTTPDTIVVDNEEQSQPLLAETDTRRGWLWDFPQSFIDEANAVGYSVINNLGACSVASLAISWRSEIGLVCTGPIEDGIQKVTLFVSMHRWGDVGNLYYGANVAPSSIVAGNAIELPYDEENSGHPKPDSWPATITVTPLDGELSDIDVNGDGIPEYQPCPFEVEEGCGAWRWAVCTDCVPYCEWNGSEWDVISIPPGCGGPKGNPCARIICSDPCGSDPPSGSDTTKFPEGCYEFITDELGVWIPIGDSATTSDPPSEPGTTHGEIQPGTCKE